MSKNLHANHRSRVRARFIKEGSLDSFEQHQVLELLLFYAVPRRDTNELAHKLLNEYGSLYTLMNSKPEDIVKRCKVSENTAVLISMIPDLARRFLNSAWEGERPTLNNYSSVARYFESLLVGKVNESFYMLCLDLNKKLKKAIKISDGTTNSAPIYIEKVVSDALLHNSNFVIIGHNHPNGVPKPSSSDIMVTDRIVSAFEPLGIKVLDHIIICSNGNYSFAQKGLCHLNYNK